MTDRPEGTTVYATVCARNYLPQVLALQGSVARHDPTVRLITLVVDAEPGDIPASAGLEVWTMSDLGLPPQEIDNLRCIYDVVEFSTAVKPLFFLKLLQSAARVVYLDPDTYLLTSLSFLDEELESAPFLLTPHFLRPVPHGTGHISDVHSLTVGVHNLGFGAFSREGAPFLDWWWSKLQRDCLIYPLLGIFVDQKWTDLGMSYFGGVPLRDEGVNVGPWNLHERPIGHDGDAYTVSGEHLLRLFHFSGFDPERPDDISIRLSTDLTRAGISTDALRDLSRAYAADVLHGREVLGPQPDYVYGTDRRGRRISTRSRRVFRAALLRGEQPPSFFAEDQEEAAARWRARTVGARLGSFAADASLAAKYATPDLFRVAKRVAGPRFGRFRGALLARDGIRR